MFHPQVFISEHIKHWPRMFPSSIFELISLFFVTHTSSGEQILKITNKSSELKNRITLFNHWKWMWYICKKKKHFQPEGVKQMKILALLQ